MRWFKWPLAWRKTLVETENLCREAQQIARDQIALTKHLMDMVARSQENAQESRRLVDVLLESRTLIEQDERSARWVN